MVIRRFLCLFELFYLFLSSFTSILPTMGKPSLLNGIIPAQVFSIYEKWANMNISTLLCKSFKDNLKFKTKFYQVPTFKSLRMGKTSDACSRLTCIGFELSRNFGIGCKRPGRCNGCGILSPPNINRPSRELIVHVKVLNISTI